MTKTSMMVKTVFSQFTHMSQLAFCISWDETPVDPVSETVL